MHDGISSPVQTQPGAAAGESKLNIPSAHDQAQPLEKEVTFTPHPEAIKDIRLSKEEKKALLAEAEIHFELDIKETDILQDYFIYYSKKHHHVFQRWLKRAEPYLPYIRKVFTEKGLPQDLIFLPFAESGFNPLAYSHAGAAGMWQFMPATGRMFGLTCNWWVDERRDPYKSTVAAAEYLNRLYKRFDDWYLVLAAYNAGGGHVSQAIRRSGSSDYFDLASSNVLHKETCRYVPKFLAVLKIVQNLEALGFEPLNWDAPAEPNSIRVQPGTDLAGLADAIGLSWSDFQAHNPSFRRSASPPSGSSPVYLSGSKIAAAKEFLSTAPKRTTKGIHRYRIRSGDTWWRLSRRFDVPLRELKQFNQMASNTLHPGQWVLIPRPEAPSGKSGIFVSGATYVVKSGDTLWGIARSMGTSVQALQQANPGLSVRKIAVGQKITLPGKTSTRQIASRRANYKVKSGDTLWGIAQRFHLSLSTLVQANGLNQSDPLKVGTQLYIPDIGQAQQANSRRTARQARIHYQVQKGDNVWSIARKFGVSPAQVMEWNTLSSRDLIHPGDTLTIYP
jgi:membrane-bound lytic murein transglycosylase D